MTGVVNKIDAERGPSSKISGNTLAVISVDNLDQLSPKARINVSNKPRYWNICTVNAVEPQPLSFSRSQCNNVAEENNNLPNVPSNNVAEGKNDLLNVPCNSVDE